MIHTLSDKIATSTLSIEIALAFVAPPDDKVARRIAHVLRLESRTEAFEKQTLDPPPGDTVTAVRSGRSQTDILWIEMVLSVIVNAWAVALGLLVVTVHPSNSQMLEDVR